MPPPPPISSNYQMPPPPPIIGVAKIPSLDKSEGPISRINLLNTGDFDEEVIETVNYFFQAYRKIQTGPNNFPHALIVSMMDYSITYNNCEMLDEIKYLLSTYKEELLPESEKNIEIVEEMEKIVKSQCHMQEKMENAYKIYAEYHHDLSVLLRNLLVITLNKLINERKYEAYRMIKMDDNILGLAKNVLATLSLEDFFFISDYFQIHINTIDIDRLQAYSQDTNTKRVINILSTTRGYFPLYSVEEFSLQQCSQSEYSQMLGFITLNSKNDDFFEDSLLNKLNNQMQNLKNSKEMLTNVLFYIIATGPQQYLDEIVEVLPDEERRMAKDILGEYCCCVCNKLCNFAKLDCRHRYCETCINELRLINTNKCKICSFSSCEKKIIF
ncbi:hypothetical protein SteCoe_32908 [Stentor coeruleus]|uniref:RING-type domain-containing protein n=1 Tax=Stentor coeruleus TaxID=5963 RepID=A0A1R2AYD4_9CILI|nr:hypothetical protein SteCoe_32908 [Stentor coeruleus]